MYKKFALVVLTLSGCVLRQKQPLSDPQLIAIGSWHGRELLTYCVDESFGSHREVILEFASKTVQDWTDYGQLTMHLLPRCDGSQNITITKTTDVSSPRGSAEIPIPASNHVTMTIKLVEGSGQILDGGKIRRDRLYGVMLHEWGHALGFDHEHDGSMAQLITAKDPRSIMYYPWENGRWHQAGWNDGWDRARMSILDKLGMMTHYPPKKLAKPSNAIPEVFSEEQGESSCPPHSILIGIACYGKYCDDKRLYCAEPTGASSDFAVALSPFISEKNPAQGTNDKMFVTGIECRGAYCGEIRLRYASDPLMKPASESCYQSLPISSDEGIYGQSYHHICRKNHAVTGVVCSGPNCGSLSVRCCPVI